MKSLTLGLVGLALAAAPARTTAWAQPAGENGPARIVWAAQKDTPYSGVNKPVTHIADILKAHQGKQSWDQPVMLTRDYDGHYVSLAPGEKTKCQFYADDRVFGWVYSGQVKITIDGQQPFTATKGYLFDVAPRLVLLHGEYRHRAGGVLSLHARRARCRPIPKAKRPRRSRARTTTRPRSPRPAAMSGANQPFLDFNAYAAGGGKSRDFAMDGHTCGPYHPRRRHHQAAAGHQLGPFPRKYGGSLGGDRRPARCADFGLRVGAWRDGRRHQGQ